MPRTLIKDLRLGMEVARDVLTPSGQCLVAEGVILDSRLILILGGRGVTSIEIREQNQASPELSTDEQQRITEEADAWLTQRYLLARQNPLMLGLRPLFLKWLVEKRRIK